jgi:Zn-finger nucleic acid-binding protein
LAALRERRPTTHFRLTALGSDGMMPVVIPVCPKCDVALLLLRFKEVEVDFCDRCRGLWLDAGEIEQLLGERPDEWLLRALNQPAQTTRSRYLCPRCDKELAAIAVNDLTLERCPTGHGLWFDEGELDRVLKAGGAHQTVAYLTELFGQT